MKKAGGIITAIGALFGIVAAFITLGIGGLGGAFGDESASTIVGLGWAGLFLCFLILVCGIVTIFSNSKISSILVIILSIITIVAGGTLVAIFMVLSLLGGILALAGVSKEIKASKMVID